MARSRVGRRTRRTLVFLHVAISVGWMGAGAANVVLAATAWTTAEPAVRQISYRLIETTDTWLVIPAAFGALVSGVVLSLVTPWGLTRYWWVLAKFVLTLVVIGFSTFGIGVWVIESIEATAGGAASPVAAPLALGAGANLVAFLFMTWASVAKPWPTTPWAPAPAPRARAAA